MPAPTRKRRIRSVCEPDIVYDFLLDDGRTVIVRGSNEEEAAATIPVIFGSGVKWAVCKSSGVKFVFEE